MDNVIDAIRAAVAPDASPEAKAAGIAACRAIVAALEGTQAQSFAPVAPASPVAALVGALRGVPPEQLLDLAIAKLRAALPAGTEVAPVRPIKIDLVPVSRRG